MKLATQIKVGLTALAGLLVVGYMSLKVNDAPLFGDRGNVYYTYFDNATGIILKTPIYVHGIKLGYVSDIGLEKDQAKLTLMGIPNDVILYENAEVRIRDKGLLGERVLDLVPGTTEAPVLPSGGTITINSGLSDMDKLFQQFDKVSTLFPKLESIAENIDQMTRSLVDVIGQESTTKSLERTIKDVEIITRNLREVTGENIDSIKKIVENLESISKSVKEILVNDDIKVADGVKNINQASQKLNDSMASLKNIITKVERGEGTVGKLLKDEGVVDNLEQTMSNVNSIIEGVSRIQTGIGYRTEFVSDSKKFQHLVHLQINPRPDKYFYFEFIDEPIGPSINTESTLTVDDGTPIVTTTKKTTDEFTFSALFAKRFYDVTVRFGLIRSEGGVAADYSLFKDHLKISFEAFDFTREERPHLRSFVTFYFLNYFLLTAGSDDLINNDLGRPGEFFAGAGLSFTDEDVRSLLSVLSLTGI